MRSRWTVPGLWGWRMGYRGAAVAGGQGGKQGVG